jgi:branched-chain amino acid transport system ATP-binding protein
MSDDPVLRLDGVEVVYDQMVLALRGVTLSVPRGAIVALLGANGAGKSTTLRAASALLAAEGGAITGGTVHYLGRDLRRATPRQVVDAGLAHVLEGRHVFGQLTVEQNLLSGALVRRPSRRAVARDLERSYDWFPRLRERRHRVAGYLSGGEQQMLAIGRALMSHPTLLLLDEPSMGLAPQVVVEIFEIVQALNRREGLTVLLAEQNATLALRYAHHGYVLENGRVVIDGPAELLARRPDIQHFYLGVGAEGRVRFGERRDPSGRVGIP